MATARVNWPEPTPVTISLELSREEASYLFGLTGRQPAYGGADANGDIYRTLKAALKEVEVPF